MVGFIDPVGTKLRDATLERTGRTTQVTKRTVPRHSYHLFLRNFFILTPSDTAKKITGIISPFLSHHFSLPGIKNRPVKGGAGEGNTSLASYRQRRARPKPPAGIHALSMSGFKTHYRLIRIRRYSIWPRSPSKPIGPFSGSLNSASRTSPLQVQRALRPFTSTTISFQSPAL